MDEVTEPFSARHKFTGPNVAISCEVSWDDEYGGYIARSDHGWTGFSRDTANLAALNCFRGWTTGEPFSEVDGSPVARFVPDWQPISEKEE